MIFLELQKYEELLTSMIGKIENDINANGWQCLVCQREYKSNQRTNLKNHIEAKHIDHISFTCCACGGVFSSRASFRTHCSSFHREFSNVPFQMTGL